VRTRLQITMRIHDLALQTEGIVRVMHPGSGMGVQFTSHEKQGDDSVGNFIHTLVGTQGAVPEVEVKPDSIDNSPEAFSEFQTGSDNGDPLLSLFRGGSELSADDFHSELRKQRGASQEVTA
jgi:hypothetical protein